MTSTHKEFDVLHISHPLHSFLIGTILGDGYITKRGMLQVEQKSYQYTKWKFDFLLHLSMSIVDPSTKITEVKRIHQKTQKESISYRFYTKPLFLKWRALFYVESNIPNKNAIKHIPLNIENLLVNPLSLAVWFMDDGGKGGNTLNGVIISVFKFTDLEIACLQHCLQNNFDIQSNFHAPKTSRQLYIPKHEYIKWRNLITPFIIPSQRYKLL